MQYRLLFRSAQIKSFVRNAKTKTTLVFVLVMQNSPLITVYGKVVVKNYEYENFHV